MEFSSNKKFKLESPFQPTGDQPRAISSLSSSIEKGVKSQVLLGVTGSGKTFTMANIIEKVQKPTLILAHNKTLAAQLYQEFKEFFPTNSVEYFVSYYDYYQPEAYIARTDTYIEKDLAINDRIDRLRLSATRALIERRDSIIVASVSCIYGLGMPVFFKDMNLKLHEGQIVDRDAVLLKLVSMTYARNDIEFCRGRFRVRGDIVDVFPAYEENICVRLEFFGNELEKISELDPLTGRLISRPTMITIYPASHHVIPENIREDALLTIQNELDLRVAQLEEEGKIVESQRLLQRTRYDLEMIKEVGSCKGIENYSRHFTKRLPGEAPPCLIDYFPDDYLIFIDESHQTIPQIHGMHRGDRARKDSLVQFGFRLPSAYDNRPLTFDEFYAKIHQVVYVSATPADYEIKESQGVIVEQVIRPTGLLDPEIEVRPHLSQVDDVIGEIQKQIASGHRILVTTLTKKLAEELTSYLEQMSLKARYLHSEIDTLERIEIIQQLRKGSIDVLVGINLLREGLDIPEVALVAILDADREGFLRSATALIQTCGRAARNEHGKVIMYADTYTQSMKKAIEETNRRRELQHAYNQLHHIIPKTTYKEIKHAFDGLIEEQKDKKQHKKRFVEEQVDLSDVEAVGQADYYEQKMKEAAANMEFEKAAQYRDLMRKHLKT